MSVKWQKLRKNLILTLAGALIASGLFSGFVFGMQGGLVTVITLLCLASGFWLTEGLVGVMTGVKSANGPAIGLLFLGKVGWWGLVFWLSRVYPSGAELPIAVGMGAFLLTLLIVTVSHYGLPKISDVKGPGEP